jgi:DNA-binding transcriptional LysR family regulator
VRRGEANIPAAPAAQSALLPFRSAFLQNVDMEWDDLRFVLAVRRAGSALRAAHELRVNQSTVTRRIAQLEAALGIELFDRRQAGYIATEKGEQVACAAEQIEAVVERLGVDLAAAQRVLSGAVRLTTSETIANKLVAQCLGAFQKLHPGIHVQLITDDRRFDIARGEADIALRAGSNPQGGGIVIRRVPDAAWAVYCSLDYARDQGMPTCREQIRDHAIIGMEGHMAQVDGPRWLHEAAGDAPTRFRSNSLTNLVSSLRAGLGVATLPCFVGDSEPELVRCFPPPPELVSDMWLIIREELRSSPHIRAFADYLATYLFSIRGALAGAA